MPDFTLTDKRIKELCDKNCYPSAQLCVMIGGEVVHEYCVGRPDPNNARPCDSDTRYDIASLTKIFAGSVFFKLCEEGVFSLDEPIAVSFPKFSGMREIRASANRLTPNVSDDLLGYADAGKVTWRHVLIHNAGLGWAHLYKSCASPDEAADYLCAMPFAYAPQSTVIYTDIGLILLGIAMENRTGKKLDKLVQEYVCMPLGLKSTRFNRVSEGAITENTAPTEFCEWRKERVHGLVHDENSYFLDGVAGHAGIFSTARDVAALGEAYLAALKGRKGAFLPKEQVEEYTRFQQMDSWNRRGILFQVRLLISDAHSLPLGRGAFGHTGFTGCCMWADPERDMVFSLLTNDVYAGRANRTLGNLRKSIVEEIVCAVDLEQVK